MSNLRNSRNNILYNTNNNIDGGLPVVNKSVPAIDNPSSSIDSFLRSRARWKKQTVNATTPTAIGDDGTPVIVAAIRVIGTSNLGGICSIAEGTLASNTEQDSLPSGAIPGTERDFKNGAEFLNGCVVTVAVSGSVLVLYREA